MGRPNWTKRKEKSVKKIKRGVYRACHRGYGSLRCSTLVLYTDVHMVRFCSLFLRVRVRVNAL